MTDGQPDDYLETLYSGMEIRYARILQKIHVVDKNFGLDEQEVVWLNYFPGELFWRVPSQQAMINATRNLQQLNQLGVALIDRTTLKQIDPKKFEAWIKEDPSYFQRLRNVLPATNYWNLMDCDWSCTVKTFTDPFPPICSDNPVILRHPEKADVFLDDLIFPLSPNKVFFRIKYMKEIFAPNIKFYIDMLLLVQAKEYVCCVNKEYVQKLRAVFENDFCTADVLRKFIFEHLTNVDN